MAGELTQTVRNWAIVVSHGIITEALSLSGLF